MKKQVGISRNQCPGCHVYFNSVFAFDMHRTGEHGVNRRCMTEEEMLGIGMRLNKDGYWIGEGYETNRRNKNKDGNPNSTSDGS